MFSGSYLVRRRSCKSFISGPTYLKAGEGFSFLDPTSKLINRISIKQPLALSIVL